MKLNSVLQDLIQMVTSIPPFRTPDGYHIIDVGSGNEQSRWESITILPSSEKTLMGGFCQNPNANFCLVQLNQDGTLDNSFDSDGKAFFDLSNNHEYANSLLRVTSGKILLGGYCYKDLGSGTDNHFCVARIDISNPTPSLDSSFNSTGEIILKHNIRNQHNRSNLFPCNPMEKS